MDAKTSRIDPAVLIAQARADLARIAETDMAGKPTRRRELEIIVQTITLLRRRLGLADVDANSPEVGAR